MEQEDAGKKVLLDKLNEINNIQTEKLSATSRHIMFAIFATNFTFIMTEQNGMTKYYALTCVLVIIYFACELLHYYMSAHKVRHLFKEVNSNTKNIECAACEMNRYSGFSFVLLQIKLILLIASILFQLYCFISMLY